MAVSISARQFQQRDLARVVRRAIDETGIDASQLELQIRETTLMRDIDLSVELLTHIRDEGVMVAIDAFGSAYSSLGSLRVLPINAVKMDRALIRNVTDTQGDIAIVGAVIGVSRSLGLRVIADGVDTREQLEFLRAQGCHEAQGKFFSPAVDPDEFRHLMSAHAPQ